MRISNVWILVLVFFWGGGEDCVLMSVLVMVLVLLVLVLAVGWSGVEWSCSKDSYVCSYVCMYVCRYKTETIHTVLRH